jgi:hypothetical protein
LEKKKQINRRVKKVVVVDPNKFKMIRKSVNKTDKNDAKRLAYFLGKDMLPEARMKTKENAQLHSLATTRDKLVRQRTALINKIHNVLNTDHETTLVVAEGSVCFESELGIVQVVAGHQSTLVADAKPTDPAVCDAESLIAWTDSSEKLPEIANSFRNSKSYPLIEQMPLPVPYPFYEIHLDSLVYEEFVESKRKWFKEHFTQIFELLNELKAKNPKLKINLDYPELLIKTGVFWQIVYPDPSGLIGAVLDPDMLLAVAKDYGLDKKQLNKLKSSIDLKYRNQYQMVHGITALEKILPECRKLNRCSKQKQIDSVCERVTDICEYLENTWALAWLCIQNDMLEVNAEFRAEILDLLSEQVYKAYECKELAWHLSLSGTQSWSEREGVLRKLVDVIEGIVEYERKIEEIRETFNAIQNREPSSWSLEP